MKRSEIKREMLDSMLPWTNEASIGELGKFAACVAGSSWETGDDRCSPSQGLVSLGAST
jgi:hypothetical protein